MGTDLIRNLRAGLRLALFLPVYTWHFRASLLQVVLLAAISFLLNLAYDARLVWPGAEFNYPGLTFQGTLYLFFFLSLTAIATACRTPDRMLALATLILAAAPTTFLFYAGAIFLIEHWPGTPVAGFGAALTAANLCWHLAIVARALWKVLRPARRRAVVLMLAAYAALNIGPWFVLPPAPLWSVRALPEAAEAAPPAPPADIETLFFRQPGLLGRELEALAPQRPGIIDVYFVGVAGDGGEDVFMNEAAGARRLFEERFDARGRSLLLVNNPGTFARLPLANNHNLGAALYGLARLLDPEEDVLVLFLTSHGEEHKGLVLDLGAYQLAGLTPRVLRASLNEMGDTWRVIIISACYSGAFIEELRSPRALIITSARADRSSFGCGHDGPFTYFGEAFIGRALREEDSFLAAFEAARERIAAREAEEEHTPSEPQIHIGPEIAAHLAHLQEQLHSRSRADPVSLCPLVRGE